MVSGQYSLLSHFSGQFPAATEPKRRVTQKWQRIDQGCAELSLQMRRPPIRYTLVRPFARKTLSRIARRRSIRLSLVLEQIEKPVFIVFENVETIQLAF
jgi:hypothetical protein